MSDLKEHWEIVSAGRIISNTPEQLWNAAVSYFKWCDEHPMTAKRTLTSGKTQGEKVTVEFVRPYTIKAFCLHAGCSERYLNDMKDSGAKDNLWGMVIEKILMIIYNQNLEGAVVDLYNPIVVSKILNLDKGHDDTSQTVKVEIIGARSNELANSENEVLKKLDLEKVEILQSKTENS